MDVGEFIDGVDDLRRLVVGVVDGSPVFLEQVARIEDGPAEPTSYSWIGFGPAENWAEGADSLGEGFFG